MKLLDLVAKAKWALLAQGRRANRSGVAVFMDDTGCRCVVGHLLAPMGESDIVCAILDASRERRTTLGMARVWAIERHLGPVVDAPREVVQSVVREMEDYHDHHAPHEWARCFADLEARLRRGGYTPSEEEVMTDGNESDTAVHQGRDAVPA